MPKFVLSNEQTTLIVNALHEKLEHHEQIYLNILCGYLNKHLEDTTTDDLPIYENEVLTKLKKEIELTNARIKLFDLEHEDVQGTPEYNSTLYYWQEKLSISTELLSVIKNKAKEITEIKSLIDLISKKAGTSTSGISSKNREFYDSLSEEDYMNIFNPHLP